MIMTSNRTTTKPKEHARCQTQRYNIAITDLVLTIKDPKERVKIFQAQLNAQLASQQAHGGDDNAREEIIRQLVQVIEEQIVEIKQSQRSEKKTRRPSTEAVLRTIPDPDQRIQIFRKKLSDLKTTYGLNYGMADYVQAIIKEYEEFIQEQELELERRWRWEEAQMVEMERLKKEYEEEDERTRVEKMSQRAEAKKQRERRREEIRKKREEAEREKECARRQQEKTRKGSRRKGVATASPIE